MTDANNPFGALVQLARAPQAAVAPAEPKRRRRKRKPTVKVAAAAATATSRNMRRTYALRRLLEHGALNVPELRAITGWDGPTLSTTLQSLCIHRAVVFAQIDGQRYYGLPGSFDYRHRQAPVSQRTTQPKPAASSS